MLVCSKCGGPRNAPTPFSKATECDECHRGYNRSHYQRNKPYYLEKAEKSRRAIRVWIDALKSNPCTDCGNKFHPCAMDFDHRPGTPKKFNIASLGRSVSRKILEEEIAKCDLVCAVCHRIRTWNRNHPSSRSVTDNTHASEA